MAKEKKEDVLSLEDKIKELNKKSGANNIILGNDIEPITDVISTGSLGINLALGCLGLPNDRGWIVEEFGWESSGKSTITQTIIGNFQEKGKTVVFVNTEASLDPKYAKSLGVNMDKLIVMQLDERGGEGIIDDLFELIETGKVDLVVIDSYNGLKPKKMIEGEMGQANLGIFAKLMSLLVDKMFTAISKYQTKFILIGQLREKIGVMFGDPATTQGGNALKFGAHVRMKVSRSTTTDNSTWDGETKTGNKTTIEIIKNKFGPPFRKASFNIIYGEGIDKISEIIDIAKDYEIINKRGDTIKKGEDKYTVAEFSTLLRDNPEFYDALREEIFLKFNSK